MPVAGKGPAADALSATEEAARAEIYIPGIVRLPIFRPDFLDGSNAGKSGQARQAILLDCHCRQLPLCTLHK